MEVAKADKKALAGLFIVALLVVAACESKSQREARLLYQDASALEAADGMAAALPKYEEILRVYGGTESGVLATERIKEYKASQQDIAKELYETAKNKSSTEALAILREVVDKYSDTDAAKLATVEVTAYEEAIRIEEERVVRRRREEREEAERRAQREAEAQAAEAREREAEYQRERERAAAAERQRLAHPSCCCYRKYNTWGGDQWIYRWIDADDCTRRFSKGFDTYYAGRCVDRGNCGR